MLADNSQHLVHKGRPKGALGKVRRAWKEALMCAAGLSKHSKSRDLIGYCVYLADERPELYVALVGRVLPKTTKNHDDADHPGHHNITLFNLNTPMSEMASLYEQRIKGMRAQTINHDPEDADG